MVADHRLELIDATIRQYLANWPVGLLVELQALQAQLSQNLQSLQFITFSTQLMKMVISPMVDEQVQTTGIVTAVDRLGTNSAFTIQDGNGAWNGIYCWWAADDGVVVGDEVTVSLCNCRRVWKHWRCKSIYDRDCGGSIVSVNSTGIHNPQPCCP